jgi:hypothetical protein
MPLQLVRYVGIRNSREKYLPIEGTYREQEEGLKFSAPLRGWHLSIMQYQSGRTAKRDGVMPIPIHIIWAGSASGNGNASYHRNASSIRCVFWITSSSGCHIVGARSRDT